MEKSLLALTDEMKSKNISVVASSKCSAQKPFLEIKGDVEIVQFMQNRVLEMQSSMKMEKISLVHHGIVQYFFEDLFGQCILMGIETEAKAYFNLEINKDIRKVCFTRIASGKKTISVYVADITHFNKAEVIVNAANEKLHHSGGVAKAIADCGGPVISTDSKDHVSSKGKVATGKAVLFPRVGNLPAPYKAIVHAVGPQWNNANISKIKIAQLQNTVKSSLAVSCDYSSIAIPAISSGVYGFPAAVCANALVSGAEEYLRENPGCRLENINFVILQSMVDVFVSAMKSQFHNVHTPQAITPNSESSKDCHMHTYQAQLADDPLSVNTSKPPTSLEHIKVIHGDILEHQCDVLVSVTNHQLSLGTQVGRVLLKAAGEGLKAELQKIPYTPKYGDIVTTGAHQLKPCKHIVHVVLLKYDGKSTNMLKSVVQKCLHECTRLKAKSISIPSFGAGNLGYPGQVVAQCLLRESQSYLIENHKKTSLQLIRFVIYDKSIYQIFEQTFSQMNDESSSANIGFVPPLVERECLQHPAERERKHFDTGPAPHTISPPTEEPSGAAASLEEENFTLPNDVILRLVQGRNVFDEQTDVIVNAVDPGMHKHQKGIPNVLLEMGGRELQKTLDMALKDQRCFKKAKGHVVKTICAGMGQLKCKCIFHVFFEGKISGRLFEVIFNCLDQAEKSNFTSIAFPSIGTEVNVPNPPLDFAADALRGFKRFALRNPKNMKEIRIVLVPDIFHQFTSAFKEVFSKASVLGDYYGWFVQSAELFFNPFARYRGATSQNHNSDSHEKKEFDEITNENNSNVGNENSLFVSGSNMESGIIQAETSKPAVRQLINSDDLESKTESRFDLSEVRPGTDVSICIYGEREESVKEARMRLEAIIDKQFITEEISHQIISQLNASEIANLHTCSEKYHVEMDIYSEVCLIKLHGFQKDVLVVKDKIRSILMEIHRRKAAITLHKHVQWRRNSENYNEFVSYDIEQAYQQNPKGSYTNHDQLNHFIIDFSRMEEKNLITEEVTTVYRKDYLHVEKPSSWAPMPKDASDREVTVHLVSLNQDDPEYRDALGKFNKTMKKRIISIQRIQNPVLYGQYIARKKEMVKRNPSDCINERWLFHGTKHDAVEKIYTQGFNRAFKNVTAYGQGVYFARHASYSHKYTSLDDKGHRRMFLTRVLTGEFTVGRPDMIVPPAKSDRVNKHVLFDSTVDNQTNPSIFVVYTDPQAYATYLITYHCPQEEKKN